MLYAWIGVFVILSGDISWCETDEDCPECMRVSCSSIDCPTDQLCVLTKATCASDPCPKLPQCKEKSSVCNGNPPLMNEANEVVSCDPGCPEFHRCTGDVCCPATVPFIPDVPVPKEGELDLPDMDNVIPPIIKELENIGNTDKECEPCHISLCDSASCPKHVDARCVSDNCSCMVWFEDGQGRNVECFQEGAGIPVIPGFDFGVNEIVPETTTMAKQVGGQDVGNVSGVNEIVPETTTMAKQVGGQDVGDVPDNAWKYGIIVACAAIVLVVIAFIIYKLIVDRRKSQDKDVVSPEEQKVPLKEVVATNGDNNNKAKSNEVLLNTPENETACSSTSGTEA